MYHGTPAGGCTTFKEGSDFTPNEQYSDVYKNQSLRTGETENRQTYYEYLNLDNPFDVNTDSDALNIFKDYVKSGSVIGIDPASSDAQINEYVKNGVDWNEADNLRDYLDENYPGQYDGMVISEGGIEGRGKSFVNFKANQVKNTDNTSSTSSNDIRLV